MCRFIYFKHLYMKVAYFRLDSSPFIFSSWIPSLCQFYSLTRRWCSKLRHLFAPNSSPVPFQSALCCDEEAERPRRLSDPLHVLLPSGGRRCLWCVGIRIRELHEKNPGTEVQRDEEEISLFWSRLQRDRAGSPASGTTSGRQAVEIRGIVLFCYNRHYHNR